MSSSNPLRSNLLDEQVNTELMRVCKCVLPYLDTPIQKNLAVSIKLFELIGVMQLYSDESNYGGMRLARSDDWEKDLLHSIRSNLSPEKAYMIDAFLKFNEFRSILKGPSNQPELPSYESEEPSTITSDAPATFFNASPRSQPINSSTQNQSLNPADILNKLSPLLDDNQKQMINLLSAFMKPNQS